MTAPTVNRLISVLRKKGCPVNEAEYGVNTVAIRSRKNSYDGQQVPNTYNDLLCVFYKVNGEWQLYSYACTTVAGLTYFQNFFSPEWGGTAIIVPSCYEGVYMIGAHFGAPALVQVGQLEVYRDSNQDDVINLDKKTIKAGNYAIQIHQGSEYELVNNWSAGCIVLNFSPYSPQYQEFISHYYNAVRNGQPNSFDLVVILEADLTPTIVKVAMWTGIVGAVAGLAWAAYEYGYKRDVFNFFGRKATAKRYPPPKRLSGTRRKKKRRPTRTRRRKATHY